MTLEELASLLAAVAVSAIAPILVAVVPGRIPQVVVLIVGGILIGPEVLDFAEGSDLELISNLGLGFLFLLAGYELDPTLLRERAGKLAAVSWVITLAIALGVVGLLDVVGLVRAFLPVSLALTTTALGTLLPIVRDHDMLTGSFGRYLFAAGAVGEMGPVICIALFLGTYNSLVELLGIATVAGAAYVLTLLPRALAGTRVGLAIERGRHATGQTTLRLTVLLLVLLLFVSERFGLDIVLGAFFAGMVLRRWAPEDRESLEEKLDAVGYGFFIPVFFVTSGINLDIDSIAEAPLRLLGFFVLLLVVRGLPSLVVYRNDLGSVRRVQMVFLTATALPLLVALTEIGLQNGSMLPENAAALVGAGVLSVALFPLAAIRLQPRALAAEASTRRDEPS